MFADIIVPVPIPKLYTYLVPKELEPVAAAGERVVIEFGKSNLHTGLIRRLHDHPPTGYTPKPIESILDNSPIVGKKQFEFWDWLASYYLCSPGEVMTAALPSGLRLTSETSIAIAPGYEPDNMDLSENEFKIMEALERKKRLSLKEVSKIIERKTTYPVIKSLLDKKAVSVEKVMKERYTPLKAEYVRIAGAMDEEKELEKNFNSLHRAPKQLALLMAYMNLSKRYSGKEEEVEKTKLLRAAGNSNAALKQLVKKEILEIYFKDTSRIEYDVKDKNNRKILTSGQVSAIDAIDREFESFAKGTNPCLTGRQASSGGKDAVLLHGVTSSGKTEIYMQLMERAVRGGKQILYLLPEIALTSQLVNRVRAIFGNRVGVYHSRFSENEKVEIWQAAGRDFNPGGVSIFMGARSAIFLPFTNLGLIIVDEEHDQSFKQDNPAPRYNARDCAIYLGKQEHAKIVLGSATPSIESYYNAKTGKYGYVRIDQRYGGAAFPEIEVVNVADEMKKRRMKSHLTPQLADGIKKALEKKEQAILFQNRRGFAPFIMCSACGWIPHCEYCDVSMVYHKFKNRLACHYCGFTKNLPPKCPACGDTALKTKGFGTEKIEEDIGILFPEAKTARMDLDTTRKKESHQKIITGFENGDIDILIGTQMVAKGLDFDRVSVVGILNADSMLGFPDFRTFERAYQLMEQVSGRAGRKIPGKVIIQTFNPGHPVISNVIRHDYNAMFANESAQREKYNYPPFCRLVQIRMRHKEPDVVQEAAVKFAAMLRKNLPGQVFGPSIPVIGKISGMYIREIMIKLLRNSDIKKQKEKIKQCASVVHSENSGHHVRMQMDVDPVRI